MLSYKFVLLRSKLINPKHKQYRIIHISFKNIDHLIMKYRILSTLTIILSGTFSMIKG